MKLLEKNLKGLKHKVCGSQGITSIRIPSNELFIMFMNIRVLRLRSTDWKSWELYLDWDTMQYCNY